MAALAATALVSTLAAAAADDPFADAASVISCPAGPPGWSVTGTGPDGRFVLTPLTIDGPADPGAGVEDPNAAPTGYGGNQVEVDCNYRTSQGGRLNVFVRYALPSDFNPFADFFVGCKTNQMGIGGPTGPQPWDNTGRLYRVISDTSWAYGGFYDYYHQLQGNDVGVFESVTNTMLKNAQTVAHNCNLALQPTAPLTLWRFGFDANVKNAGVTTTGSTTGTFMTSASSSGVPGKLASLKASNIVLAMTHGSKQVGSVTLAVTEPVSFKFTWGGELRAIVQVKDSTFTPCRVGATGTLTVSAALNTTTLQVCHRNLLDGVGFTAPAISG